MRTIPASELIINDDGSIFHLHLLPEQLADTVILVGDPGRVALVAEHFDTKECEVANREFKTVTGTYKGKRMTVLSTGIGIGNIDISVTALDALASITSPKPTSVSTKIKNGRSMPGIGRNSFFILSPLPFSVRSRPGG